MSTDGYIYHLFSCHSIETSASRNKLSLDFQYNFWSMIGALSRGLMVDPQDAKYITSGAEVFHDTSEPGKTDPMLSGMLLFIAGAWLMLLMEAVTLPFSVDRFGWGRLPQYAIRIGTIAYCYHQAKQGETWAHWLLIAIAFGVAAITIYGFMVPPPDVAGRWTSLKIIRIVVFAAAGIMLILPMTRRYVSPFDPEH